MTITPDDIALVRAYTEGNMESSITVRRGQAGTLDPATGRVGGMSNAVTIYSGKARIPIANSSGSVALGEGQVPTRQLNISVPIAVTDPRVGDVVLITSAPLDAQLQGSTWHIVGIDAGGAFGAVRHLTCSAYAPGPRSGGQ